MSDVEELARRAIDRCAELAVCSDRGGEITRPPLTPAMQRAHELVTEWLSGVHLTPRVDAIGNLIGDPPPNVASTSPTPRVLYLGSHLDTIRDAGPYDGMLGITLSIAALELFQRRGVELPVPVSVLAFSDEEGMRFSQAYYGSRALVGEVTDADLDEVDEAGITVRDAILAFGGDPAEVAAGPLDPAHALAFLEPHIEQGPVLDTADVGIGVVTGIAGQRWFDVTFHGRAAHAGTTPMGLRKDALAGGAELILAVEALTKDDPALVATVGRLESRPGVSNAVAGYARASVDLRHLDGERLETAFAAVVDRADAIARRRGLTVEHRVRLAEAPTPCHAALQKVLREASEAAGAPPVMLPSGAGHDARILGRHVPMGMLFIRSPEGTSHHPEESVRLPDVALALEVMYHAITALGPVGPSHLDSHAAPLVSPPVAPAEQS